MNRRKIQTKINNYKKALKETKKSEKRINKMIAKFPADNTPRNVYLFKDCYADIARDLIVKIEFYERVLNER